MSLPPPPPGRRHAPGSVLLLTLGLATAVVAALLLVPVLADADRTGASAKSGGEIDVPSGASLEEVRTYEVRRGHSTGEIEYDETPPVGGEHHPVWLECGVYDVRLPENHVVHDLEHGTVWLTYRPGLAEEQVAALADLLPDNGLLSPYPDQSVPVVVTVWERQLDLTGVDDPRLPVFLRELGGGTTAPEPFASCAGGATLEQLDDLDQLDEPDQPDQDPSVQNALAASRAWTARP